MRSKVRHYGAKGLRLVWLAAFAGTLLAANAAVAGGQDEPATAQASEPPPLPFHSIEGVGGVFITPAAYLVNPGPEGAVLGKPALGTELAMIGHKDFEAATLTWTIWRRLELGYALNRLGLDDLPADIRRATGVDIRTHDIFLHHLNARVNIIQENQWEQQWLPALTAGVHYKHNDDVSDIDRRLGGALRGIGMDGDDGLDFTLTASKTLTWPPRPVIVSAGARASKGAQLGFLGFADHYSVTFEGHVVVLVTDKIALGAEYRQKPDELDRIPGLIGPEDDWWDVCAGYIINDHMTIAAGVGNFGTVANHRDQTVLAAAFKYEF